MTHRRLTGAPISIIMTAQTGTDLNAKIDKKINELKRNDMRI